MNAYYGSSGDDMIGVHNAGIFTCGEAYHTYALGPWYTAWTLNTRQVGEDGSDMLFGGPTRDYLVSDISIYNDDDNDWLCGYGGNDNLAGDFTDTSDRECMSGGGGTADVCDGNGASNPDVDQATGCETVAEASTGWTAACGTESAVCGTAAPDLTP